MAQKRKKRRRRDRGRFGALYKLAIIVLVPLCIIAGCVIFFRVGEIHVTGVQRYSETEVTDAAGISLGENLLFLNKQAIERQLLTKLPYVESVELIRDFPDSLQINVTECVPAAAVEGEDGWWLMDHRCKLLEPVEESKTADYITVKGLNALAPAAGMALVVTESERTKLDALKELMSALQERDMLSQITYIDLTSEFLVKMGYTEYFEVEMPVDSDFAYMMRRLVLSAGDEKIVQGIYYTVDMTIAGQIHYIPK